MDIVTWSNKVGSPVSIPGTMPLFVLPDEAREAIAVSISVRGRGDRALAYQEARRAITYPFAVEMPCGTMVRYHTEDEVPRVSVPCPCGDVGHWLIRYE